MIRTTPSDERSLAAVAMLAAADAVTPAGSGPSDPLERIAWAARGEPFEAAGIQGLRGGLDDADAPDPISSAAITPAGAARLVGLARLAAGEPHRLGAWRTALVPRAARHAAGQFYTPLAVAARVIELAGFPASRGATLLDPMCGSGVFVMAAMHRLASAFPRMPAADLAARVHGMESDPLAVLLSRCGALITLGSLRGPLADAASLPPGLNIRRADALSEEAGQAEPQHDVIAGNPPWVAWDNLPASWRRRTRDRWKRHGLFPEDGRRRDMQAVLGSGRKDLSMLATYVAAQRWLAPGGVLSFVLTRSVLKSVASGAGFRRFVLSDGTPLGVQRVEDLGTGVFPGIAARPVVLTLRKGEPTRYPVPWAVAGRTLSAEPVDPARPGSAWITAAADRLPDLRRLLGPSPYPAHAGAYTGGANGVYWLRREGMNGRPAGALAEAGDGARPGLVTVTNLAGAGKRAVPEVTVRLEAALIYPLLRAADVGRFRAEPSAWILMAQDPARRQGLDEATMRARYPHAWEYLRRMEPVLRERRDRGTRALIRCGAPPWTMFSVSGETMSPWKVVWPRIASRMNAAVAGPMDGLPAIPQETCTFVACGGEEEASYLAGLLNSARFQEAATAFADTGGKSFGAPHLLRHIAVPRYRPEDPAHLALAGCVMGLGGRRRSPAGAGETAHEDVARGIDALADAVWDQICCHSVTGTSTRSSNSAR